VSFLFPFLKGRWKKSADNKKIGKKMAATERYVYAKKMSLFCRRARGAAATRGAAAGRLPSPKGEIGNITGFKKKL
jgi:hypothetical protein